MFAQNHVYTKDTVGPVMSCNGQLVDDDYEMCEEFNSYFSFTRDDINMVLPDA